MNKKELLDKLALLINKYIENSELKQELLNTIDPRKIKYILDKFEKNKKTEVTSEERELIQDIYFNFC